MEIVVVHFSPNGTTLKTLRNVLAGIEDAQVSWIDMADPANRARTHRFHKGQLVIYGTITAAMLFAPNLQIFEHLEGNGAAFAGVGLYGNGYYGVALRQLVARARARGFLVVGVGAFIGQHAVSPELAAERPDATDAAIQADFGREIARKTRDGEILLLEEPAVGWSTSPLYNTIVLARLFMMGQDYVLPRMMKTKERSDACVRCGLCERRCPMQAIDLAANRFDYRACIACNRCVNSCPQHAITVTSIPMNAIARDFPKRFDKRKEPEIYL